MICARRPGRLCGAEVMVTKTCWPQIWMATLLPKNDVKQETLPGGGKVVTAVKTEASLV